MNKIRLALRMLTFVTVAIAFTAVAQAQATRTWVSGVGDDANPCSRTAPCKTFAGAISKTATAGKINVLDPGGFGGVTITKSITISSEGFEAGVLVSGTNAIIVNVPNATDAVILRGLDFEGLGTGLSGEVREPFLSAIQAINAAGRPVLAIDIPSGLDCDTGRPLGAAVRATVTVTFVAPKIGFSAAEAIAYVGRVIVADIGVPLGLP